MRMLSFLLSMCSFLLKTFGPLTECGFSFVRISRTPCLLPRGPFVRREILTLYLEQKLPKFLSPPCICPSVYMFLHVCVCPFMCILLRMYVPAVYVPSCVYSFIRSADEDLVQRLGAETWCRVSGSLSK